MAATSLIAMGALTAANAYAQSEAQKSQGEYRRAMADLNAQMGEYQATQAERRGEVAARKHNQKVRGVVGSQRADFAANGIDVNTGSAVAIQRETMEIGEADAAQIKSNAWAEAWGYRTGAENMRSQGRFDQMAANNSARATIVTGGLEAVNYGMRAYSKKAS